MYRENFRFVQNCIWNKPMYTVANQSSNCINFKNFLQENLTAVQVKMMQFIIKNIMAKECCYEVKNNQNNQNVTPKITKQQKKQQEKYSLICEEIDYNLNKNKDWVNFTTLIVRWIYYCVPIPLQLHAVSFLIPTIDWNDWINPENEINYKIIIQNNQNIKQFHTIQISKFVSPIHFYKKLMNIVAHAETEYLKHNVISYQDIPQMQAAILSLFDLILSFFCF